MLPGADGQNGNSDSGEQAVIARTHCCEYDVRLFWRRVDLSGHHRSFGSTEVLLRAALLDLACNNAKVRRSRLHAQRREQPYSEQRSRWLRRAKLDQFSVLP